MSTEAFLNALRDFHSRVQKNLDMNEHEVYNALVASGFFNALGYSQYGIDIRSQIIVDGNKPDFYCLDSLENVIFAIETKRPTESLASGFEQLWQKYVIPLKARYGVLTNGLSLRLYERINGNPQKILIEEDLGKIKDNDCNVLLSRLKKPDYDFQTIDKLIQYVNSVESASLEKLVVRDSFFKAFALEKGSTFSSLLMSLMSLHEELLSSKKSRFLLSAWRYWIDTLAVKPEKFPQSWIRFLEAFGWPINEETQYKFMFCLETAHSIIARLVLSKACQDIGFPDINVSEFLLKGIQNHRSRIIEAAYPLVAIDLSKYLRSVLVSSIFEDDIYSWWTDPYNEMHHELPSTLQERQFSFTVQNFSTSLRNVLLILIRYDFRKVQGDLLGDLYQAYFDRETRRALGEFYTPEEVVDYIVESVGYKDTHNKRILDPSCGSGTFVAAALRRYLAEAGTYRKHEWGAVLKELCYSPRIVGFDIHPFACLMAQIRFMLELLAPYKFALVQDYNFKLARIPIFRTDSLSKEIDSDREEVLTLFQTHIRLEFPVNLPLQTDSSHSLVFKLPSWNELKGIIDNADQYYAATLALFDLLKSLIGEQAEAVPTERLERALKIYLSNKDFHALANIYKPYAEENLTNIRRITSDLGNGRLTKSIEDSVLSTLLKAYLPFDFVVGNPPWVSKQTKKGSLSEHYQFNLQNNYISAIRDFDLHIVFAERGLRWLKKGGMLGFIVSSTFTKTAYGEAIRAVFTQNRIKEIVDFTDYDVFDGATNLSTIMIVQKATESWLYRKEVSSENSEVLCTRVSSWPDHDLRGLMNKIRSLKTEFSNEVSGGIDMFKLPYSEFSRRVLSQLGKVILKEYSTHRDLESGTYEVRKKHPSSDIWIIAPFRELQILSKMEEVRHKRLARCTMIRDGKLRSYSATQSFVNDIHQGLITSGKDVYVVRSVDNFSLEEVRRRKEITIVPKGLPEKEFSIETGLLKFLIDGRDIEKWSSKWTGELLIVPYLQKGASFELLTPVELRSIYPKSFEYFADISILKSLNESSGERKKIHEKLIEKFGVKSLDQLSNYLKNTTTLDLNNDLIWYRFMRRQNVEIVGEKKIMLCTTSNETKFAADLFGNYAPHNVRVYSLIIELEKLKYLLGILNSTVVEFYLNHVSVLKKGKTFEYLKQNLSTIPIPLLEKESDDDLVAAKVNSILSLVSIIDHVESFPLTYLQSLGATNEEFDVFIYKSINDGIIRNVRVQDARAGLGKPSLVLDSKRIISSPLIDTLTKAEYVKEALEEKRFRKGQSIKVQIPRNEQVCKDALEKLKGDKQVLANTNKKDLEREINDIVLKIYGLGKDDKIVIEDYLSRF